MKITKLSIQRSTIVVVIFSILIAGGIFSFTTLNYELLPKFTSSTITIATFYPGAAPEEVEMSITKEVEDAVSSMEGIKKVTSTSQESFSLVMIELVYGQDADMALQDAQRKVDAIVKDLPDDADPPSLSKVSIDDLPIIRIGAFASMSPTEFYELVDKRIKPVLGQVPGVARVRMLGGDEREINILINRDKLNAYNLSVMHVAQAVESSNLDFPTGKIKNEKGQQLIRLAGKFSSVSALENLVITSDADGSKIFLKDVAEVRDMQKETEVMSRVNMQNAIGLTIQKQSDANAVEVSELVRAKLKELEDIYKKESLAFNVAQDSSTYTMDSVDAVVHDLVIAIVLVSVIMLLFLHSIRNAIIVMISVPASLVATFIVMSMFNFSLNLMTLLGMSLVIGILVDDAIVVIENIYRHLEMGKNRVQAAYDGVREIGATVTSITLVIVVVFLPIAMTTGLVSDILRQFSIVVATSTMLSLFVAFTLIPLLSSRFSKLEHINKKSAFGWFIYKFEGLINGFSKAITGLLQWSFNHKFIVLGLSTALTVLSFALVPMGYIGSEFISGGDRGEFILKLELDKNATIEQTSFATKQVEQHLMNYPEIVSVFTTIGTESSAQEGQNTAYLSEVNVKLVAKEERSFGTEAFTRQLKKELEESIPGVEVTPANVSIVGTADKAPIEVILTAPNLETLWPVADSIMDALENISGTAEIETSIQEGNPEIQLIVNREKMAQLGLTMDIVGANLRTAFNGRDETKFRGKTEEYDINIQLDQFDRRNTSDIEELTFTNNRNELVKLKQFADIVESEAPSKLERFNRITSLSVQSQVIGRPTGSVGADIQEKISQMNLPDEVNVQYGGELEQQEESFGTLGVALLASLFLVYLIMVGLYDSYIHPLVVMFSVPLAIIGALFALALTKSSLNIFSILGMIMLIGLVAKNAILVVDFTNALVRRGMDVKKALVQATHARFRPILMTTLAMVFGMLPIALASGAGAEWKNGLAWVLIGGLISSMFLTLVVVPLIYYIFERIMEKLGLDKKKEYPLEDYEIHEGESEIAEAEKELELA
ncbi:efflux RND transporter permease subunit [Rapidithrix thailandica]|uniref:Efflux RND transporter permease subunit n=1 Tax=Rapidithrix thailandica TaxID=413964 RepID=A0AAW9RY23_9BACT